MDGAKPIPLHGAPDAGQGTHAGTGFLVTDSTSVWLVTCAHIVSGKVNTPPDIDIFAHAKLYVVGTEIDIPLCVAGKPMFNPVTHSPTGFILDAIAVKLTPSLIENLAGYGMYDLRSVVPVKIGQRVTISGFPGLGKKLIPATTMQANIDRITEIDVALSKPTGLGYSGGPVTRPEGLVGMTYGDVGKPSKLTNAVATLFAGPAIAIFSLPQA
ncbi:hypothetical protein GOE02_06025 [Sinorhizobium medicae]|nr:hypothetical protein [Sinorhizobium medicae]